MFSPPTPHFYKIILDGFLRMNKLRLPRRFIRKHGNELSSQVQLRVSDGLTFKVEVTRSDGEVWFDSGWHQFCEHYSLKQGYLVLFEYEGHCSFGVVIFDTSATEIDYPYVLDGGGDEECQQLNNSGDEEDSNFDNEECPQPHNYDEEETNNDNEECPQEEEEDDDEEEEHISDNSNLDDRTDNESREEEEEEEELNRTSRRKKYRPPKRRGRYISSLDVASDEECQKEEEEEVLRRRKYISDSDNGSDEECQKVLNETPPRRKNRPPKSRRKYISSSDVGSDEECQEEEVLRGRKYISNSDDGSDEECQEVLNETPPKRRRKTTSDKNKNDFEDASGSEGALQTEGRLALGMEEHSTPLERASAFESDNPFFVVEMQPSYLDTGRKMAIPSNFTAKYLLKKADDITLCTLDGKTWYARYLRYASNGKYIKAVLYDGWRKFARENKLELGDVCVFELAKQTKITLKVVIYRIREDSNCCSSAGGMNSLANCVSGSSSKQRSTKSKHRSSERRRAPLTALEKAIALLKAKDFKSENPYFKVVLQPAYIGVRWRVYIPHKFAEKYLDEKKGQVILQVSGRGTWVVKFSIVAPKSGQLKAQFYSTWKKFALDNNLEVGDVCVFELIDQNKGLFEVSIF